MTMLKCEAIHVLGTNNVTNKVDTLLVVGTLTDEKPDAVIVKSGNQKKVAFLSDKKFEVAFAFENNLPKEVVIEAYTHHGQYEKLEKEIRVV